MTLRTATARHWRIPTVAVLGAALAFGSSYAVSSSYQSSTRLVIHGRDAGFLSSSGQNTTNPNALIDSTQATTLADTYGSMATSRAVAEAVVGDLKLDHPAAKHGFVHDLTGVVAWTYRCGRAFLSSGFCAPVNQHEKAINDVVTGTTALQLGTTAGANAGQPGSYVLEVTSSGETPAQAQSIANAVADELVKASSAQVKQDAATYVTKLQSQLTTVKQDVTTKGQAVTSFETANNVSTADQQLVVTATTYQNLQTSLRTAQAGLASNQAQLSSIQASLAATDASTSSGQQISTGRSTTTVTTNQSNPVYQDLLNQQSQTQATIAGLQAQIQTLQGQLATGSPTNLSGTLAQLGALQQDLTDAQSNQTALTGRLNDAQSQAATAAPDLSRLDVAGRPDYPVSPKRYLYLLIGLVVGALAGGGLTWLSRRRGDRPDPDDAGPDGPSGGDDVGLEQLFPAGNAVGGPENGWHGVAPDRELTPTAVGGGSNGVHTAGAGEGENHADSGSQRTRPQ